MPNLASKVATTLGDLVSEKMTDMSNQNTSEETLGTNTGPVTVVITHKTKRGCEKEFKAWLKGINQEASHYQGYMGVQVIEPHSTSDRDYIIIVRFDSYEHLKGWNASDIRKYYLEELHNLTDDESKYEYQSGLDYWFSLPKMPGQMLPPKHKMAFVIWLTLTPLILLIPPITEPLLSELGLPKPIPVLLTCAILVALMTYALMPLMTRMLKKWLFHH